MSFPKIEGYLVVEKLGFGSYATVYKAFSKKSNRDVVAIKCIERVQMKGSVVDNLITEISLLKSFKHPHIVLMKDFQWDEKYVYIVTEYCNYGDLSKYLKKEKGIPERVCRQLLRQLALALQHLRERGVVHMDLKPQNLLLHRSTSGEIILKVADFGFAQHMSDESRMKSLRGSPLYMAPEVFLLGIRSDKKGYDAKVDLWSVGVILYECLFGKAPYSSNTYKELVEKITSHKKIELPPKSYVSQECRDMLTSLLQHDPEARMSYEEFFDHDFLDMKHMPSPDNYKKAVDLVRKAVEKDSARDFEAAYHLYCESLRYFVPMVTEESDSKKKDHLRAKVNCYIKRAEELKLFTICGDGLNLPSNSKKTNQTAVKPKSVNKKIKEIEERITRSHRRKLGSENNSSKSDLESKNTSLEHENQNLESDNQNSEYDRLENRLDVVDLTDDHSDEESVAIAQKKDSVIFKRNTNSRDSEDGSSYGPSNESEIVREEVSGSEEVVCLGNVESGELRKHVAISRENFEKLYALCTTTVALQTGLEAGIAAEMYVREGRLEDALRLYRSALTVLLKGCQTEPPGVRRTMLADKIDEWLREAESIKALLESREMEQFIAEDAHKENCCLQ